MGVTPLVRLPYPRLAEFLNQVSFASVVWGLLNLLPIYPLDGFHILMQLLPTPLQQRLATMTTYGRFLLVGLIVADQSREHSLLAGLISPVIVWIMHHVAGVSV